MFLLVISYTETLLNCFIYVIDFSVAFTNTSSTLLNMSAKNEFLTWSKMHWLFLVEHTTVCVFDIWDLCYFDIALSISNSLSLKYMDETIWNLIKSHSWIYWNGYIVFVFNSIALIYYTLPFVNVELSILPWHKYHFIVICYPFGVGLNLSCFSLLRSVLFMFKTDTGV